MADPVLARLRTHKSEMFHHTPIKLPPGKNNKRAMLKCSLCSSAKGPLYRQTAYKCATCKVPLCRSKGADGNKSCHELWHEVDDLKQEHARLNAKLGSTKSRKRGREDDGMDDDGGDSMFESVDNEDNSYSFLHENMTVPELPGNGGDIQMSLDAADGSWSPQVEEEIQDINPTAV